MFLIASTKKTNRKKEANRMSNREKIIALLDSVPDYKMGYVLAYVQGITADEEADDLFCERMLENYENDPDPEKDKGYSLDECKQEWGLA